MLSSRKVSDAVIKVTVRAFCNNKTLRAELKGKFPNTIFNEDGRRFNEDELVEYLKDVDAALIGLDPMTEKVISQLPKMKMISKFGVGLDNVDLIASEKFNKSIGWTSGVNRVSVAEEAVAFMIGLCRNLFMTSSLLNKGEWYKNGGVQFSGKTIGIIGCGNIGSEVVKMLQSFGNKILVCDLLDKSDLLNNYNANQVELNHLLTHADIITLHVPLTVETFHMINDKSIQMIKNSAFIINTSRGPIVDQESLKTALINGTLAGAALDVYEEEPPTDLEFLSLPNLVATPHIAGNSEEAVLAMGRSAINHLTNHFVDKGQQ